jgi:hypothetical protein
MKFTQSWKDQQEMISDKQVNLKLAISCLIDVAGFLLLFSIGVVLVYVGLSL